MHSRRTIRWQAADNFWASVFGAAGITLALWAFVDYVSKMPVA